MINGLAFVTGASGFIGSNLTRQLIESGREVRILIRPQSCREFLPRGRRVQVFVADLKNEDALKRAVQGCDEVYHVAADYRFWTKNPKEIYDNNVVGTKNILSAALQAKVRRFVHTSTVGTIGLADQPNACDENTAYADGQFNNHYKLSKLQAEQLAFEYYKKGLSVVVVNPSTPIGSWDGKPTPTGKMIVDFVNGKIPAYIHTGLNFIHVVDVAKGHILASEKGQSGERYILGNQNLSMKEFLGLLSSLTGVKPPKYQIPYSAALAAGYLSTTYSNWVSKKPPFIPLDAVKMAKNKMYFDSKKAISTLGLPQTPIKDAASEAISWFYQNGYFKPNLDLSWRCV